VLLKGIGRIREEQESNGRLGSKDNTLYFSLSFSFFPYLF
jgi:hypothetical protein